MNIEEIKIKINQAIRDDEPIMAVQLLGELSRNFGDNSELSEFIPKLQFIRLMSLSPNQALKLLEGGIQDAYSIAGFDLAEKIMQFTVEIELMSERITFLKNLKSLLRKDDAMLGRTQIKVDSGLVDPTVGNWILDYEKTPAKTAYRKEFDELNFVNNSANVRVLSPDESKVLLNILKLYDYINNSVSEWDATPAFTDEKQIPAKFDLYDYIPGILTEADIASLGITEADEEEARISAGVSAQLQELDETPSVETAPVQEKPVPSIDAVQPNSEHFDVGVEELVVDETYRPTLAKNTGIPLAPESKAMQDLDGGIMKKYSQGGIVMDRSSNVKIDEVTSNLVKEKEQTNQHISRKLEELRKRKDS